MKTNQMAELKQQIPIAFQNMSFELEATIRDL